MEKYMRLICIVYAVLNTCTAQDPCGLDPEMGAPSTVTVQANIVIINQVREDLPTGSTVIRLRVLDDQNTDLIQSAVTPANTAFSFDPETRSIIVTSQIAHSESGTTFTIICSPQGTTTGLKIKVYTLDLNDHAPVFTNAPYIANISEYSPVGTTVISSIRATDADTSNPHIFYSVLPGAYSDHFEFPLPAQGKLVLRKMVDFEETQQMTVNIQATDSHLNTAVRLTSNTTVTVYIMDESDQNPVFNQATYMGTVTETDEVDTVVELSPSIMAHDPDHWRNSSLTYSIVPDTINGEHEYFALDPQSAELTLQRDALTRGTKFCLLIQVTKADDPQRYSQALVRVIVQAANSSPPRFLESVYVARLVENTEVGSPVVTVTAIDNDEATILRYSFAENYPEFAIDSNTGAITTASALDFNENERFSLSVMVSDGQNTDDARVEIDISPINKYNPQFIQTFYEFYAVDIEKDMVFVKPQATDDDKYSSITYSFLTADTSTNFSINSLNGEVKSLVRNLPEFSFVVVATDDGNPSRQGSCLVRVVGSGSTMVPSGPDEAESASGKDDSDSNMAALIAISVVAGILLVLLIVLVVFIIRRKLYANQDSSQTKSRCVRSQSFEQNPMNFSSKNYKSYLDPMTDYKPSDRHLQLYNGVTLDGQGTSTQENPFSSQDSLDDAGNVPYMVNNHPRNLPSHSAAVNAGLYPIGGATAGDSFSDTRSGSTLPGSFANHHQQQQRATIEYDTALSPMDLEQLEPHAEQYGNYTYGNSDNINLPSPRSSLNSDHSYNHGELTSFKVGSTTQLVPSSQNVAKSGRSLQKGSGNISFVDHSPTNSMYSSMTSQQSGMDPAAALEQHGRSGITLYY